MRISDWSSDVCSSDLFKFETSYSVNSKPFSGLRTTVESKKSRKFKIRHKRIIVVRSRRLHPIRRVSLRRKLNRILDGERRVTAPVGPLQTQLSTAERRVGKEWCSKCKSRGWSYD